MNNNQIETNVPELFSLIGEREFLKYKLSQEIAQLNTQITEMSEEITKLKAELKEFKIPHAVEIKRG